MMVLQVAVQRWGGFVYYTFYTSSLTRIWSPEKHSIGPKLREVQIALLAATSTNSIKFINRINQPHQAAPLMQHKVRQSPGAKLDQTILNSTFVSCSLSQTITAYTLLSAMPDNCSRNAVITVVNCICGEDGTPDKVDSKYGPRFASFESKAPAFVFFVSPQYHTATKTLKRTMGSSIVIQEYSKSLKQAGTDTQNGSTDKENKTKS